MIPPAHLGTGYLTYTLWTRILYREAPADTATLALALGTQFPDLVDKPLYVYAGVYNGRAVMHSLLVVVPLCGLVYLGSRQFGRSRLGSAFGIGVLTHLAGDALMSAVRGTLWDARYLGWPVYSPPVYGAEDPLDHLWWLLRDIRALPSLTPSELLANELALELLFSLVVFLVWILDGYPTVRTAYGWTFGRLTE